MKKAHELNVRKKPLNKTMLGHKQKHIFATRSDIEPGLKSIESHRPLKYALCEAIKSPDFKFYNSLLEVEQLGINTSGDHISGDHYLVVNASTEIKIEKVPQINGSVLYFLDPSSNPNSIVFWPGGLYDNCCLICGHIGIVSEDLEIIKLYRDFSSALTKGFKKIGNYYVGPEAHRLLNKGMRLITINVKSPHEYDLNFFQKNN